MKRTLAVALGMMLAASTASAQNNSHMWEHYGNLVTYMRLKGIVPPSSERQRRSSRVAHRRGSALPRDPRAL